jgi:hypothetical protein
MPKIRRKALEHNSFILKKELMKETLNHLFGGVEK